MATATNRALGNLEATKALGEHPALVTTHETGSRIPTTKDLNNAPTGPFLMDKVVVAPNKASQPGSNSGTDNSKNYLIIGGILIILFIVFKPGQ